MLTMTVWEACKPLLILFVVGAFVVVCLMRRVKANQNHMPEKLPVDSLSKLFVDEDEF